MTESTTLTSSQNQTQTGNSALPGLKVMLEGGTGTGKTHSVLSLIEKGITPFIIFTEPGMSTIQRGLAEYGYSQDSVKWCYVSAASQSWEAMKDMGGKINQMSFKALSALEDGKKAQYRQFLDVYSACHNFTDTRTGEEFGDVTTFGTDRCLVFDSLSGLSRMSMNLMVGAKPTKSPSDWGVAMDNLERFLIKITTDISCHVGMTAHLAMEKDEINGGIVLMPQSLGNKLSPKIAPMFDEVIHTRQDGEKWYWSTATRNVETKTRMLPISDSLEPGFGQLIDEWTKAGGVITDVPLF